MIIALLIFFALIGVPLFSIIGAVAIYAFTTSEIDTSAIIIEMVRLASAPTLLAIPLFTFTGYVLAESGAPRRMVDLSRAMIGWMPGGVPVMAILSCAVFSAFTGASGVTIIALGGLLYPILITQKYPEKFTIGLLTASGSLGLLLPPSLPVILYGIIAETEINKLFVGAIIPEIILLVMLSVFSIRKGLKREQTSVPFSLKELIRSVRETAFEIPLPIIIIIGIYSGFFTPTEAAAISSVYVIIVETFIYRDLNLFKDIPKVMVKSMVLVGSILIILGAALGLTNYIVDEQVPMKLLGWMQEFVTNKYVFLALLNIFLLIVGCLMDIFSAIIVVVPLIKPVAISFGIDPIHLGIIFLLNLEIGYLTPPIGINLFISSSRFNKPIIELYKSSFIFLMLMMIALIIITYIPWLSEGFAKLVYGLP